MSSEGYRRLRSEPGEEGGDVEDQEDQEDDLPRLHIPSVALLVFLGVALNMECEWGPQRVVLAWGMMQ
jgi:hypothetical protein